MGVSRSLYLKNGRFLPETGLKISILGQKHYFMGLSGQFKAPQPYFTDY